MAVKILKIINLKEQVNEIKEVARALENGAVVAFPTETVYGIGVNAYNLEKVQYLFKIKKRAFSLALTYHLGDKSQINQFVKEIPKVGEILIDKFLPGPLTLIFKKSSLVPNLISGNTLKVGIRIPKNNLSLEILKQTRVPIVATSANLSGYSPAASISQILSYFPEELDYLIEGEYQPLGLASTVLDITFSPPRILRAGFINKETLERILGITPILSEDIFYNKI